MLKEIHRIFMGDQELLFLLEVLFRTGVVYAYTLALLRWIGGRSVAQLSIVEFLLVIAIGSAVGDSLFYPGVPLIPAMFAIFLVVVCNKLIDRVVLDSPRLCRIFEGKAQILMVDGQLDHHKLRQEGMGRLEFYLKLRDKGITDLSQVRLAVLEPNGALSILTHEHAAAGPNALFTEPALEGEELSPPVRPAGRV